MYTIDRDQSCEPVYNTSIRKSKVWKIDHCVGEIMHSNFLFDAVRYKITGSRRLYCVGYEYVYDFKLSVCLQKKMASDVYGITKTFIWRSNRHELALAMLYQDRFKSKYLFFIKYLKEQGLYPDVTKIILQNIVDTTVNDGKSCKIVYDK